MKILEVVDLDPNKFGSFEKYCLGFGVYLRSMGHQHYAIFKGEPCSTLQEELNRVGGSFSSQYFNRLGVIDAFLLIRYILKNNINVVHLHFYPVYSVFSFASVLGISFASPQYLPSRFALSASVSGTLFKTSVCL